MSKDLKYYSKENKSQILHPLQQVDFCKDFLIKTKCDQNQKCTNRHISYTQLRKEIKAIQPPYKKHLCNSYEVSNRCQNHKFLCLFAHGEPDIWGASGSEKPADHINMEKYDFRMNDKQLPIQSQSKKSKNKKNNKQPQFDQTRNNIQEILEIEEKEQRDRLKKRQKRKRNKKNKLLKNKEQQNSDPSIVFQPQFQIPKKGFTSESELDSEESDEEYDQDSNDHSETSSISNSEPKQNKQQQQKQKQQYKKEDLNENSEDFETESYSSESQYYSEDDLDSEEDEEEKMQNYKDLQEANLEFYEYENQFCPDDMDSGDFLDDCYYEQQPKGKKNKNNYSFDSLEAKDQQLQQELQDANPQKLKDQIQQMKNQQRNIKKQKKEEKRQKKKLEKEKSKQQKIEREKKLKNKQNKIQIQPKNNKIELQIPQVQTKTHQKQLEQKPKQELKQQQQHQQQQQVQSFQKEEHITKELKFSKRMDVFCFFFFKNPDCENYNYKQDLKNICKNHKMDWDLVEFSGEPIVYSSQSTQKTKNTYFYVSLSTTRKQGLQFLKINLVKDTLYNLHFKLMPSPEIQIVFSNPIKLKKNIDNISFLNENNEVCYVYGSRVEQEEGQYTEYKLFDLKKTNANTRKLEQTVAAMLNTSLLYPDPEQRESGKIILGVRDNDRVLEGIYSPGNISESFFTILRKRFHETSPSSHTYVTRTSHKVYIPSSTDNNIFYPIVDCKVYILTIKKNTGNHLFQAQSGLFQERIEEGCWPISSFTLFQKFQEGLISQSSLEQGLKKYDQRYVQVISKKIDGKNKENSGSSDSNEEDDI